MSKFFRISPALYEVDAFVKADSADAAILCAARANGFESVNGLNANLEDENVSAAEVSKEYIAALNAICNKIGQVSERTLMGREAWEPTKSVEAAINVALSTVGAKNNDDACRLICFDLRQLGFSAGDWIWVPMMKIAKDKETTGVLRHSRKHGQ